MMTPHLFISKLVALMTKHELPTLNAEETSIDLDVVLASLAERLNREAQLDAQAVSTVFNQIRGEYEAALYHELVNGAGYSEKRVRKACLAARGMVEKLDAASIPQQIEAIFEEDQ